jgi:phosphoenolpyruvate carboxykinase (ATP)
MTVDLQNWLHSIGVVNQGEIFFNPNQSILVEESLLNHEVELTHDGAIRAITTPYTGRSPNDKFIVDYQDRSDLWWGEVNRRISPEFFEQLQNRITAYLNNRKLYVIDCFVGADPKYCLSVRIVTEFAWQALASQHLFIYDGTQHQDPPELTILATPDFNTNEKIDQMRSKASICIDLREKTVLIAGSKYFCEVKKSAFTIMNAALPRSGVLPMHCSANVGKEGDVALYFGLSGTGKTTLSSTPDRKLIGDDEHGWGDNGVFNFEGGCYAKVVRLNPDLEPVIWYAANHYASVFENVMLDPSSRQPDFNNTTFTENTRAAYPLSRIKNVILEGQAGHPSNIFFLTADAFGVMPPIAKLDSQQAIYYFLSGYTSKVAGTERGVGLKPKATFSTCFGEPFLPLKPSIYARLLQEKIEKHHCSIWLVNTGWTGGDFNSGKRMPLPFTRRMINWILSGEHTSVSFHEDPIFEIAVPDHIEGIPNELLYPKQTWQDLEEFVEVAQKLRQDFRENYQKFHF